MNKQQATLIAAVLCRVVDYHLEAKTAQLYPTASGPAKVAAAEQRIADAIEAVDIDDEAK